MATSLTPEEAPNGALYVDNSILEATQCSTKVFLRYIHGYTSLTEKATLKAGDATHQALAIWFAAKDKPKGAIKALDKYEEVYRDFADAEVPFDDRLSWENTHKILEHWMANHGLEVIKGLEVIPGFVEVGFAYALPVPEGHVPEFYFCGRFDLLVRWRGEVYVWDHKTTGAVNDWFKNGLRDGSQLTGYLWAAKKITERYSVFNNVRVSGVLVNAIEFRLPPQSNYKCPKHGLKYEECGLNHLNHQFLGPYSKSPEALVEWEKTAIHLAKKYREILVNYPDISHLPYVRTQGRFYGTCRNCDAIDFCAALRPLEHLDSMMAKSPWSPYEDVVQRSQAMFLEQQLATKQKVKHVVGRVK